MTEIILMLPDKTIQFEADFKKSTPDVIKADGNYYQMVNCGFRPKGNGVFIFSVVYKPAVFFEFQIPSGAQIFKSVLG